MYKLTGAIALLLFAISLPAQQLPSMHTAPLNRLLTKYNTHNTTVKWDPNDRRIWVSDQRGELSFDAAKVAVQTNPDGTSIDLQCLNGYHCIKGASREDEPRQYRKYTIELSETGQVVAAYAEAVQHLRNLQTMVVRPADSQLYHSRSTDLKADVIWVNEQLAQYNPFGTTLEVDEASGMMTFADSDTYIQVRADEVAFRQEGGSMEYTCLDGSNCIATMRRNGPTGDTYPMYSYDYRKDGTAAPNMSEFISRLNGIRNTLADRLQAPKVAASIVNDDAASGVLTEHLDYLNTQLAQYGRWKSTLAIDGNELHINSPVLGETFVTMKGVQVVADAEKGRIDLTCPEGISCMRTASGETFSVTTFDVVDEADAPIEHFDELVRRFEWVLRSAE